MASVYEHLEVMSFIMTAPFSFLFFFFEGEGGVRHEKGLPEDDLPIFRIATMAKLCHCCG
jgi:hypothetical protein